MGRPSVVDSKLGLGIEAEVGFVAKAALMAATAGLGVPLVR